MKKSLIIWGIFSFLVLVFIYMFTLILTSQERSLALFETFVESAKEQRDFDEFVAYQSIAYEKILIVSNDTYSYHLYQSIAKNGDVYQNQFVLFVLPFTDVSYAESITDPDDQTKLIVTNQAGGAVIFDSSLDDNYKNQSISYGIGRIGFYYYTFFIEEAYDMHLSVYDYEGTLFLDYPVQFSYRPFVLTDISWDLGMTSDEKNELLDLDTYLRPAMVGNITLFLVIDFAVLGLILFFHKYKKR
jgi:hypothetical protein